MLANIESESSFNPTISVIDTNGKISYGICQWNASRFDDLRNYCNSNGYDYTSIDGQLKFLKYELEHSEKYAFSKVKMSKTLQTEPIQPGITGQNILSAVTVYILKDVRNAQEMSTGQNITVTVRMIRITRITRTIR